MKKLSIWLLMIAFNSALIWLLREINAFALFRYEGIATMVFAFLFAAAWWFGNSLINRRVS